MIAYFDTSALVKLLLDEEGSPLAAEIWLSASARVTSVLAYAEGRAALAAARRHRRLSPAGEQTARALLEDRWQEMAVVALDEAAVRAAGDLTSTFAVRGCDAVHLAAALALARDATVLFATWDTDLSGAAHAAGLAVAPAG